MSEKFFDLQRFATIYNNESKKLVSGTKGNDSIENYNADSVTIDGGLGNDYVYNSSNSYEVSILGGAGNDTIYNNGYDVTINGGAGNDSIYHGGNNVTINGGKGNDSLWGNAGADTFLYFKGEGKDVIYGFEDNDMLLITGDFTATYNQNKDEVYFKVGNVANAITLKDFSATSFKVNGFSYKISGSSLVRK